MSDQSSRFAAAPGGYAPAYPWALVAAVATFCLYALTLAPTTQFWDTSEYIATSHILGIPHPPGNPLFVLLGRSWEVLLTPLGLPVAVRVNLFSAFMSSAAHGFWFLVIQRVLATFSQDRRFQIGAALAAVMVSATAFTVWNQSNVNEKVYTVSLFTIALITWLVFYWRDHEASSKDDNLLVLIAFILALSVGNHLMAFLAAPAAIAFVLMVRPRVLLNGRLYGAVAVAMVVGLSVHLFLPLRAAMDPIINEADPTCGSLGSALLSIVSWGQAGCAELSDALSRRQYDKPPLFPRLAPLWSQFVNYFQYFDWQWGRAAGGAETVFPLARLPFTLGFALLGASGAVLHYRSDRTTWTYLAVLFGTLSVGLVIYLNFRYGYSLAAPIPDRALHEVRERDYFFIVSFSVWGLWAGVGIAALWRWTAERWGGLARAAPVLGLAAVPLVMNYSWATRAWDWSARDFAYNLLMSVEPYAVLFTNGDNDTFPLWYLQEVEGIRQDVTVIVTSYLNTGWYVRQLRGLTGPCPAGVSSRDAPSRIICQRPYDPGTEQPRYGSETAQSGVTMIRTSAPVRSPDNSIITIDDELIDRIAGTASRIEEPMTYQVGRIRPTIPAGTLLAPWNQFALAVIQSSLGERPVYFASSGSAPESLGLRPYLIREGLAFRLFNGNLADEAPPGVVELTDDYVTQVTGRWVDVPKTRTLVDEVFQHHTGIPDEWPHWPDRSTIGIPNYYAWVYYALAQAAIEQGNTSDLERFQAEADAWIALGT